MSFIEAAPSVHDPVCGDLVCAPGEDVASCPQDCVTPVLAKPNPVLHRQEMQIVDNQGNPVKLRGPHFLGWLMWEGVTWGAGFTSDLKFEPKALASLPAVPLWMEILPTRHLVAFPTTCRPFHYRHTPTHRSSQGRPR